MECESPTADIRAFLATAVAGLHERVDRAMTLEKTTGVDAYRNHLRCHARVVFPIERKLQSSLHAGAVPDSALRWRSGALAADLAALGEPVPDEVDTPVAATLANFAGCMYVLEGSRLGAKVLMRQLAPLADLNLPTGFLTHGAGGKLWPSFVKWLNSVEWSPADRASMRDSARAVFRAYLAAADET